MNRIARYFLQGLLYTVPITFTVFIVWEVIYTLDEMVSAVLPFDTWGAGFIIVLIFITLVGFVGNILVKIPLLHAVEDMFSKAPLIRIIYTSVKDLISSFVGQKKKFNKPVLVQLYPQSEIYRIGFLSDEEMKKFDLSDEFVTVYVPHSYAISGQLFIVSRNNIKEININSTDVMKYIVSGGVTEAVENEQ